MDNLYMERSLILGKSTQLREHKSNTVRRCTMKDSIKVERKENGMYVVSNEGCKKGLGFKESLTPEAFKALVRVKHLKPKTTKTFEWLPSEEQGAGGWVAQVAAKV